MVRAVVVGDMVTVVKGDDVNGIGDVMTVMIEGW